MNTNTREEYEIGSFQQYNEQETGKVSGGDDSSIEPADEAGTGEVLHCLFPGCMKGMLQTMNF